MKLSNAELISDILSARRQAGAVVMGIPGTSPAASSPAPLTERDFAVLLAKLVPGISEAASLAIATFRARRLTWSSAVSLGTTLLGIVSLAVKEGAPLVQDQSARTLVILIFGVLFDTYLVGLLPIWLKPFAPTLKGAVIQGLESLYRTVIKSAKQPVN